MDDDQIGQMGYGLRAAFKAEGQEGAADAFMSDCVNLAMTADSGYPQLDRHLQVQMVVSLALQRIFEWARRHEVEDSPETVQSASIIGAFTALGIGASMFDYDLHDVLHRGVPAAIVAFMDNQRGRQ